MREGVFNDVDNVTVEEILCLTVKNQTNKQILTWGTGDFKTDREDVTYIRCNSERNHQRVYDILDEKLSDIITGWNCKFFDMSLI